MHICKANMSSLIHVFFLIFLLLQSKKRGTTSLSLFPPPPLSPPPDMLSSSSPEPLRVDLRLEKLHYTISLNVGNIKFPRFLVDTASSDFVIRTNYKPYVSSIFQTSANIPLPKNTEHNLYVDDRIIKYKKLSTSFSTVKINLNNSTETTRMARSEAVTFFNSTIILSKELDFNKDDWTVLTESWANCSGVFGLGFPNRYDTFSKRNNDSGVPRNNTWSGLLLNAISPNLLAFSLDFDGDSVENNQPTLWMGGVPSYYRSKLIWAEYNPIRPRQLIGLYNGRYVDSIGTVDNKNAGEALASSSLPNLPSNASKTILPIYNYPDNYYRFQIHDLNLCNVTLTQNVSSSWPVLLDSGAACLMLPSSLYDSVISWLGSSIKEFGKDVWMPIVEYSSLPVLSFALEQQILNVPRKFLYLPLASLIYQRNKWMVPELCIIRTQEVTNDITGLNGLTYLQSSKIVFGSLAMKNFFIGVDMGNGRIALSNTKNAIKLVNQSKLYSQEYSQKKQVNWKLQTSQCANKQICVGHQSYYAPLNQCLPPKCNSFLFKAVNRKTYICEWDGGILAGFVFSVIALIVVEFNSGMGHMMFVRVISLSATNTTSTPNNHRGNLNLHSDSSDSSDDESRNRISDNTRNTFLPQW